MKSFEKLRQMKRLAWVLLALIGAVPAVAEPLAVRIEQLGAEFSQR